MCEKLMDFNENMLFIKLINYVIYCEFYGCKNDNFQINNCDRFLISTQNKIVASNEYLQIMFLGQK